MKYVFYITNHGYGHASRNVPIINELIRRDNQCEIFIKSDFERCNFLKRNFGVNTHIHYFDDCSEYGLAMVPGKMEVDVEKTKTLVLEDMKIWPKLIEQEKKFISQVNPNIVISDIICWGIKAAYECDIPSLLISNFTWVENYKSYFGLEVWQPYAEMYKLATKALWYEPHGKALEGVCSDYENISMVARSVNSDIVQGIRTRHDKKIVFISMGKSADLMTPIDASGLPYDFIVTKGLNLKGENVEELPEDIINTPDYIAAADYIIIKAGWSTIAEVLLQGKKCGLLFRGDNAEDESYKSVFIQRRHCIEVRPQDMHHLSDVIQKLDELNPTSFEIYHDDTDTICDSINSLAARTHIGDIQNNRCAKHAIPFNKASITDREITYVTDALKNSKLSGDGPYTMKVYKKFEEIFRIKNMLLTTSGTTALEMASLLINLEPGDEVIVPSFTFSSTANAFMLRRAVPVFCDIRPDTMNIDETKIEALITPKTKAIYTVDYAGFPCEYEVIQDIAKRHNLFIIEDAAQAVGSTYHGKPAGTLGDFGCYSFHETKNYVMGEGGGLVVNDEQYMDRAEIIREKGTNRRQVLKGMVDKYTWHDIGSSFLPSDVLAAILYAQLERHEEIYSNRRNVWNIYHKELKELEDKGLLKLPVLPDGIEHNAHMYNIILPTDEIRTNLVAKLKEKQIYAYICYVPLHSAPLALKLGYKPELCPITEDYGKRVLRLPLYADMTTDDAELVVNSIKEILMK